MPDTADSNSDELLQRIIVDLRQYEVPDFPHADLPGFQDAAMHEALQPRSSSFRRAIMNRRFHLCAASLVVLIATGLLWITVLSTSPTSFAFGDVKEAVSQSRSVRYTVTTTGWRNDPWPDPYVTKVMSLEPGLARVETGDGEQQIFNSQEGRFLLIRHNARKAMVYPLYPPSNDSVPAFDDFSKRLRDIPSAATRKIGERETDGRRVIEFLWKQNGTDFVVSVDATTKLPVRMEVNRGKVSKGKEIREVYSDFVFDARMDESLFRTVPPEGYEIEERVPDESCDSYPQKDSETLVLSPTDGMGPVKRGMTTEEIIRLLGKPDWITKSETIVGPIPHPGAKGRKGHLQTLEYDSRGFHITVTPSREISISCFNQHRRGPMVRDFVGRTKEGIRLGASRDEVRKTYGKPEIDKEDYIKYIRLGWEFFFRNKKLCSINVSKPPRDDIQIRVLSDGSILEAVPGVDIDAMIDEDGNLKKHPEKMKWRPAPTSRDDR